MLGETDKSSDVCRTASVSEMGHEQRAATSSTVTDRRRKNFLLAVWPLRKSRDHYRHINSTDFLNLSVVGLREAYMQYSFISVIYLAERRISWGGAVA